MNKSEIASRINQPTEKLDAILKDAGLPTDVEQYSPEQIESLEAIAKMVETRQAKNFKDAGGLYRKIQNEAELQKIAARYSMGDRMPEITSALKLKPESITAEQLEQFRVVCEQVQQGMDLGMVANAQLEKGKAPKPQPESGSPNQAVGTALAPRKESAPTTTRPMPDLVKQGAVKIEHVPLEGEAADLWGKIADIGASVDAETLATSPFDGIKKASARIRAEANALEQYGSQVYLEKFGKAFNDPALLKKVAEQNLGKFPSEWDLNSKIQL